MTAGFPQSEKATKMGTTVFHNLILEVMYHHHSALFQWSHRPSLALSGRGLQRGVNPRRQASFQAIVDTLPPRPLAQMRNLKPSRH